MNFLDALGTAKATGIALLIWGIALFLAGGAALEARIKSDDRTKINLVEQSTPAKLVVRDEEVSAAEYNKVVQTLTNIHQNVTFTTGRQGRKNVSGIRVGIDDVSAYYTFVIVIYDIMTAVPDARWQFDYICAGEGCSGNVPYQATLKAYRKKSTLQ